MQGSERLRPVKLDVTDPESISTAGRTGARDDARLRSKVARVLPDRAMDALIARAQGLAGDLPSRW